MMRRHLAHPNTSDVVVVAADTDASGPGSFLPVVEVSRDAAVVVVVRSKLQQQQQRLQQQLFYRRLYYFPLRSFCVVSALVLVSIHLYLLWTLVLQHHPSTTTNYTTFTSNGINPLAAISRSSSLVQAQQQTIEEKESTTTATTLPQHQHQQYQKMIPKSLPPPLVYPNDYQQYTIRINSWKRPEQLQLAINHFASCAPSVAQIQVVWCVAQGEPPQWLLQMEQQQQQQHASKNHNNVSVIIEQHEINSLNERFRILPDTTSLSSSSTTKTTRTRTAAILSIDDDVLRPCVALDAAFIKWTRNPHRLVGFDARTIEQQQHPLQEPRHHGDNVNKSNNKHNNNNKTLHYNYKYGYLSTTEKTNEYALTLSRFVFVHQHYLHTYMTDMPQSIRDFIDRHFNCEDIALSLWVSYQTNNLPPLLADYWAMKSQIKLYSKRAISSTSQHKEIRDECVQSFVTLLQLNVSQLLAPWVHYYNNYDSSPKNGGGVDWFECGADEDVNAAAAVVVGGGADSTTTTSTSSTWWRLLSPHLQQVHQRIQHHWKNSKQRTSSTMAKELKSAIRTMAAHAFEQGYLKDTEPWRKKFGAK